MQPRHRVLDAPGGKIRQQVEVSTETLAAILNALDSVPGASAEAGGSTAERGGGRRGEEGADGRPASQEPGASGRPRIPAGRSWGFTVQLYSLRSRRSWGHGDLHDLADLAGWSARDLGAGFVLINPLHAAEPLPPVSPSPYLPMTRRYVSPLYLRIEDIAEYQQLDARQRERIDALAAPLRERNATADLIDRDAVWGAKREALEIIRQVPMSDRRREEYQRFRRREGRDLEDWAAWCARAEMYGPDWRSWPGPARDPRGDAQRVGQDGQGEGSAAARAERAGIGHEEALQVVRLAGRVQDRGARIGAHPRAAALHRCTDCRDYRGRRPARAL